MKRKEAQKEKTPLDRSKEILSQIKEMQHYSITNIEKLTGFYLELKTELQQKEIAENIYMLLNHQHRFNDHVDETINSYEMYQNRIQNEA